ncbi:MAG: 3-oxoacyl-ACP synthase [Bacteroidetes bacterium]|nr:3-oxoacyl-ACP synthase [Bacteroidota bacterium]
MDTTITTYTRIRRQGILSNDQLFYEHNGEAATFAGDAYKHLQLSYPKFHKMDLLCKAGLLATETALKDHASFQSLDMSRVAIVLANRASSLETDRQHQRSISDKSNYFPSPAVFVYTLPNIVIGEIAIKYKITGENAFFVCEHFDAALLHDYAETLLKSEHTDAVLAGWTDVDQGLTDTLIYLVERSTDSNKNTNFKPHSFETINQLYTL